MATLAYFKSYRMRFHPGPTFITKASRKLQRALLIYFSTASSVGFRLVARLCLSGLTWYSRVDPVKDSHREFVGKFYVRI